MTAIRARVPASDEGGLGVHSLDHFVLTVPDLAPAKKFYSDFGLHVCPARGALALMTFGSDHHWGLLVEGTAKKLHHLSFGCYPDDLAYLQERAEASGVELLDPPQGFESNGFWCRDPSGLLIEIKVAERVSPAHKTCGTWSSAPREWPARRCGPRRRWCVRADCRMCSRSPPTSTARSNSIPALLACGCRTAPTASPSCTPFTAAITTSWRSRIRPAPACIIAVGTCAASTTSGLAPCTWRTRDTARAGALAVTCWAPIIFTTMGKLRRVFL